MSALDAGIIPDKEAERMAAVRRYDILDTPPDGSFDHVTAIAARLFKVPISIVSIVDHDRIWFKSHHGVPVTEVGRDPGLCASAILGSEPYILPDAKVDPRSLANPLVAGDFGLRFYAGVPLRTSDGFNLGTLCVIDKEPRPVDQHQIDDLVALASVVMDQMELRLAARRAVSRAELMAREIEHRVRNSLQFISGLLTMQSRESVAGEAAEQLRLAADRVIAVAQVHRNFHADDADKVSCIAFLHRLCADLSRITGQPVNVTGDDGEVPTILLQPIGLIVNELVTNASKHGAARCEVAYRLRGKIHELSVSDDGSGLPGDFDPARSKGLGMKVVRALAEQLHGRLATGPTVRGGACFKVTFSG